MDAKPIPSSALSDASGATIRTGVRTLRVPKRLQLRAAERLVSQGAPHREALARRMLAAAPGHGIDLSFLWASVDGEDGSERVRQVCLAVPGAGRTMMLFCSEPPPGGDPGGSESGERERVDVLNAACAHFGALREAGPLPSVRLDVRLAQSLPEPRELVQIGALRRAGFVLVGELLYMRRVLHVAPPVAPGGWPGGLSVVPVSSLGPSARQDATVLAAMECSYEETLDCPELCGLRETRDVLASHKATGVRDPSLWFVVIEAGTPAGCMLLARCPEQRSVELVYLGLAPRLRGRGIASRLLGLGIERSRGSGLDEMACAVDARNTPAISLYERFGFRTFARRSAYVRQV